MGVATGNVLRSKFSVLAVCGHAALLWAFGSIVGAMPAHARTDPAESPAHPSDDDRRRALNERMQEMVRSGHGARLAEAGPAGRDAPAAGSRARAARTAGRRYTAPRLDLTTPPRIPDSAVECLTQALYYEARNESEEGQAAVAEVVINRSRSGGYPRDICQVVYQRNSRTCQFTFTCDGSIGRSPIDLIKWARAERIAKDVYEGRSTALLPQESVNYHANYVNPSWSRRLERVRQIGAHIFYGSALGGPTTPGATREPAFEPARSGSLFVRNAALDRAYAEMAGVSGGSDDGQSQ